MIYNKPTTDPSSSIGNSVFQVIVNKKLKTVKSSNTSLISLYLNLHHPFTVKQSLLAYILIYIIYIIYDTFSHFSIS